MDQNPAATSRCRGLRDEHVEIEARAACLSGWPHGEHEIPAATTPAVYAVRGAVAHSVSELIRGDRVPGLTDEDIVAGMMAEAVLRVDQLDRRLPAPLTGDLVDATPAKPTITGSKTRQANVTPGNGQVAAELRRVMLAEPEGWWRGA